MSIVTRRNRRPWSFKDWVNSATVSGWLLVVVGVVCIVGFVVTAGMASDLENRGAKTTAQVVAVNQCFGRFCDSTVDLAFTTAAGEKITATVGNYLWDPKPRVGDRPTIIYDPQHPADNVADARLGPDNLAPTLFIIGAVLAWIVAWLTFAGKINWREFSR